MPAGKPSRFLNNTVVTNNPVGFSCASSSPVTGSIVFGNLSGDGAGCAITACCTGDPLLTADYHLMAGSPCIDKLDPAMSVPDDIGGQARPLGSKSHCGASEFAP